METRVAEVADGIHLLSTHVPDFDFTFNQVLVSGDEPLLFHTGGRVLFPLVADAVARVIPIESLRWVSFGHVESDECGSMNQWLEAAPGATVVQGNIGCMVSITDLADRPPRALGDGEVLDNGGHRLRWIDTPHVPHGWEAGVLYDETTRSLLCGDLFARGGGFAASDDADPLGPAGAAEDLFGAYSLNPTSGNVMRKLAELDIATLVPMHAPAYSADCSAALRGLADDVDQRIAACAG